MNIFCCFKGVAHSSALNFNEGLIFVHCQFLLRLSSTNVKEAWCGLSRFSSSLKQQESRHFHLSIVRDVTCSMVGLHFCFMFMCLTTSQMALAFCWHLRAALFFFAQFERLSFSSLCPKNLFTEPFKINELFEGSSRSL